MMVGMALIPEPRSIPLLLRLGIAVSDKVAGRPMLPARLLAWLPRAALGAGVMEALVAHEPARLLRLVRLTASFTVGCAFCVDLNAHERDREGVTDAELDGLRALATAGTSPAAVAALAEVFPDPRERLAVEYAHRVSSTPPELPEPFLAELTRSFDERELVTLASTIAQVNFWARFNQALGVPPAGFTDVCEIPTPPAPGPGHLT